MLLRFSRKLALGACDRELELPRQPAKLPGGSLRGGWSTGALGSNRTIASGEGSRRDPPLGALRGSRRGRSGSARRAAWSAVQRAQRAFSGCALGARRVLFQRRARSSSLSPALARSLSLLAKSLSGVFCSGAARAAAHQGASRRARHARAMRTAASQLGKRGSKMQFSPRGLGPSPEELPLHAPQVFFFKKKKLRVRPAALRA